MPMELYSSEAFVRDIVNAISESEGKPLNIGSTHHQGIDRAYAFQLISEAKRAIEGNTGPSAANPASSRQDAGSASPPDQAPAANQTDWSNADSRAAAIRAANEGRDAAAEPPPAQATKRTASPRTRKTAKA